jgi:hypothetical protein
VLLDLLKPLFDLLPSSYRDRRHIRLTVHRAFFPTGRQCYFINATNQSRIREVEITHAWIDGTPRLRRWCRTGPFRSA